jgi:hypothetical protein
VYEKNDDHSCGKRIQYRQMNGFNGDVTAACKAVGSKYEACSACIPPLSSYPN